VRRIVAVSLLALVALFVAATGVDACDDGSGDCPPGCHVSCRDGCGSAPVDAAQRLGPAAELDTPEPPAATPRLLDRATQPEIGPPRS
jgi:hypothetical protein